MRSFGIIGGGAVLAAAPFVAGQALLALGGGGFYSKYNPTNCMFEIFRESWVSSLARQGQDSFTVPIFSENFGLKYHFIALTPKCMKCMIQATTFLTTV